MKNAPIKQISLPHYFLDWAKEKNLYILSSENKKTTVYSKKIFVISSHDLSSKRN